MREHFLHSRRWRALLAGCLVACLVVPGFAGAADDSSLKEAHVAYISDYTTETDLPNCLTTGNGIVSELNAEGGWIKVLSGNAGSSFPTRKAHFKDQARGGSDHMYADAADIALFCGHGRQYVSGSYVAETKPVFLTSLEGTGSTYTDLPAIDAKYGDQDAEWVVWDASVVMHIQSANGFDSAWDWYGAFSSLHLMMGWSNSPNDALGGQYFFDALLDTGDGAARPMKTSWFASDGGCYGNAGKGHASVIGEHATHADDYLPGEGTQTADQPHDGTWTYWTYWC